MQQIGFFFKKKKLFSFVKSTEEDPIKKQVFYVLISLANITLNLIT